MNRKYEVIVNYKITKIFTVDAEDDKDLLDNWNSKRNKCNNLKNVHSYNIKEYGNWKFIKTIQNDSELESWKQINKINC